MGIVAHDPVDNVELRKMFTNTSALSATTAVPGVVKKGAAVTDCVPAADGTSAGEQLNLLLAQLRLTGVITA